MGFPLTLGVS